MHCKHFCLIFLLARPSHGEIVKYLTRCRYKTRYLCVVQYVVIQCREVADLCGDPDLDIVALGVADLVGKTDIKAFLYKISS